MKTEIMRKKLIEKIKVLPMDILKEVFDFVEFLENKNKKTILHLTDAKYIKDYQIWARFNDGVEMLIDLEKHLNGEVFEPLKDVEFFRQVKFNTETYTVEWPNSADFAPEFLYEIGQVLSKTA